MAKGASMCLFLFLLSVFIVCCSGTLVGFSFDSRKSIAISSPIQAVSFLKVNKFSRSQIRGFAADQRVLNSLSDTRVSVDLYLNETQVENLINYKTCAISWLKAHLFTFLPHVNITSIIVSCRSNDSVRENQLPILLSTFKSLHSMVGSLRLDREMKVSVRLSLSFLENLNQKHQRDLQRILELIHKARSFVIIETNIAGELSMGDRFVELVIERATLAAFVLPYKEVSVVLTVKSSAFPSAKEVAEFNEKISSSLEHRAQITGKIVGLIAEVSQINEFEQKELRREEEQMLHSSHRELLNNFHLTKHDSINPPTRVFPTTPITNPVTVPPDNPTVPTPTIVTVPATNPVTLTPNPASTPVTVPSTTPVPLPDTGSVGPVPITNPDTTPSTIPGAQPITNPVTTYPPPSGGVPVTTPTNPVTPPATTNAPAVPGQSWCVATTGALETALQSALDYACGIGGADCSMIQQSGSCYNPNTLQNHASYAFNSYYQKNPVQTSCNFGGTAMITNVNPSSGSCVYLSSASSSATPSPTPPTTTPSPTPTTTIPSPTPTTTMTPPTPTATSSPGAAVPGSGSPPTVLNTSNPASGITTIDGESPPSANPSSSMSTGLQPFIGCIILVTSMVTEKIILGM